MSDGGLGGGGGCLMVGPKHCGSVSTTESNGLLQTETMLHMLDVLSLSSHWASLSNQISRLV